MMRVFVVLFFSVIIETLAFANKMPSSLAFDESSTLQAYVEGNNLYVAFVNDDGYEVCYWFCPTMANNLFSFHRVGYRTATTSSPSAEGISSDGEITWLNMTTSDNIGPIYMRNGGWIGGNHLVNDTRTAVTTNVTIMADNATLTDNDGPVNCHHVTIDVENDILDPSSAITTSGTFSEKMLSESVHYNIIQNAIEVIVCHSFSEGVTNTISKYYGMQSMFCGEDKIMTPHGPYTDFTIKNNVASFNYIDYPTFNRFIEMNSSNGWCQASHLLPEEIGDHRYVGNNYTFITTNYDKNYHVLINNLAVNENSSYMWHGIYSWFRPFVNDENILVYCSVLNNKEVLYVDTKRACDITFALPDRWISSDKKIQPSETDNNLTLIIIPPNLVRVIATQATSGILECTDISTVEPPINDLENGDEIIFDLQGHQIDKPSSGFYLIRHPDGRVTKKYIP